MEPSGRRQCFGCVWWGGGCYYDPIPTCDSLNIIGPISSKQVALLGVALLEKVSPMFNLCLELSSLPFANAD